MSTLNDIILSTTSQFALEQLQRASSHSASAAPIEAGGGGQDSVKEEAAESEPEGEYEIEEIFGHQMGAFTEAPDELSFWVKWKAFDHSHNSWLREKESANATAAVAEYWKSIGGRETALAKDAEETLRKKEGSSSKRAHPEPEIDTGPLQPGERWEDTWSGRRLIKRVRVQVDPAGNSSSPTTITEDEVSSSSKRKRNLSLKAMAAMIDDGDEGEEENDPADEDERDRKPSRRTSYSPSKTSLSRKSSRSGSTTTGGPRRRQSGVYASTAGVEQIAGRPMKKGHSAVVAQLSPKHPLLAADADHWNTASWEEGIIREVVAVANDENLTESGGRRVFLTLMDGSSASVTINQAKERFPLILLNFILYSTALMPALNPSGPKWTPETPPRLPPPSSFKKEGTDLEMAPPAFQPTQTVSVEEATETSNGTSLIASASVAVVTTTNGAGAAEGESPNLDDAALDQMLQDQYDSKAHTGPIDALIAAAAVDSVIDEQENRTVGNVDMLNGGDEAGR